MSMNMHCFKHSCVTFAYYYPDLDILLYVGYLWMIVNSIHMYELIYVWCLIKAGCFYQFTAKIEEETHNIVKDSLGGLFIKINNIFIITFFTCFIHLIKFAGLKLQRFLG